MLNRPVVCKLLKNKKENTQSKRQIEFIAKKQFNDILEICKYEICIQKSRISVQRILFRRIG